MDTPPRLAERLLRWSLADDERDAVLGDLHEEFIVIARDNPADATHWYWSQAIRSVGPNLARRLRQRAAHARQMETDEDRKSRLRARTCGATFVLCGLAMVPRHGEFTQLASAYLTAFGVVVVVASFLARRPVDPSGIAVRRRRYNVFSLCYFLAYCPRLLVGRTHMTLDAQLVLQLIGLSVLVWPERYWVFGAPAIRPLAPQIRTPFIGSQLARDGSVCLTVDAPDTPASLGDPILVREPETRIGIDRRYSSADTLRVFAVVGEGDDRPDVRLDVIDPQGQVLRSVVPSLESVELVNGSLPVRVPKVPVAQIDQTVSLHDLSSGVYLVRLTASDGTTSTEKYAEFSIGHPSDHGASGERSLFSRT